MENDLISIIIPSKNEGFYIERTLSQFDGILESLGLEIVVSDANSTDQTVEIVRRFEHSSGGRIRLVQRSGKQNIAIGRNFGASHAKGDILFHMDADVIIPQKEVFFKKIRARFKQHEVVAATVPIWIYPEESGWSDKIYHVMMNGIIRFSFAVGVFLAKGECQLVRRSTFEKIQGYDEKIVAGEDCNLFYRLHKEGKIAYLNKLCVYHSPRRFRQYGYLRLTMIYFREALWLLFRKKSYVEEWKPVR
jgi:glycosyltransferase involved in cell wall biosynthesis